MAIMAAVEVRIIAWALNTVKTCCTEPLSYIDVKNNCSEKRMDEIEVRENPNI